MALDQQAANRLEAILGQSNLRKRATDIQSFVENIGQDAMEIVEGLKHLPEIGKQFVEDPFGTVGGIAKSILYSYVDIIRDPKGSFLKHPLQTALDVLPIAGATWKGARFALGAGQALGWQPGKVTREVLRVWRGEAKSLMRQKSDALIDAYTQFIRGTKYDTAMERLMHLEDIPDKALQKDLVYYMQKTHNPEVGDIALDGVTKVEQRLRSAGEKYLKKGAEMRAEFDKMHSLINESGLFDDIHFRREYLPMLFKTTSPRKIDKAAEIFKNMLETTPFKQSPDWTKFAEAFEQAGLKMRFDNPAEFLEYYKNVYNLAKANIGVKTRMVLASTGDGMAAVSAKALPGYVRAPDFNIPKLVAKQLEKGLENKKWVREGVDPQVLKDLPALIKAGKERKLFMHPEIAEGVWNVVKPSGFDNIWLRRLHQANQVMKKLSLSFSFFHHFALTESNFAVHGLRGGLFKFFKKEFAPADLNRIAGDIYGQSMLSYRRGLYRLGNDVDFARKLHRLEVIGEIPLEGSADAVLRSLESMKGTLEALGKGTKGFEHVLDLMKKGQTKFDKMLWEHYYNGMKAYAFSELVPELQKMRKFRGMKLADIEQEAATFINDAFGGLAWNKLRVSGQAKQAMSIFLMAPDWTLANIRIAGRGVVGLKKLGHRAFLKTVGREIPEHLQDGVMDVLGRRYWKNMAISQFMAGNAANFLFSGIAKTRELGEDMTPENIQKNGHFMWENDYGRKFSIILPGGRDKQGRKRYVTMGKQAWEPLRWISSPLHSFGAKMAPATQTLIEQVTGTSTTGYDQDFKGMGAEGIPLRIKSILGHTLPIGFSGSNFAFTLPSGAATTGPKLINEYKAAIIKDDRQALAQIDKLARENGFKPRTMRALATREIKRELKKRKQ